MQLNYVYRRTSVIEKHLRNLDVLKRLIDLLPQLPAIEENLRRNSLLKSSLFSAKIEGNTLGVDDLRTNSSYGKTRNRERLEVYNILHALKEIHSRSIRWPIDLEVLLNLHAIVLKNISPDAGRFRTAPSAIFNIAGVAVYMTPPPREIKKLIHEFIERIQKSVEPGPVEAAVSHFIFEKIHPFLDGNGRVGRLISAYILERSGYGFHGIVSIEEYLNDHRESYYDLLSVGKKDITGFVEFFLEALDKQAEQAIERLQHTKSELPEDRLLPRRRELLEIIRDHKAVAFDFLKRRFSKIPDSTLHYDLSMLRKDGFIKKLGTTRAAVYAFSG